MNYNTNVSPALASWLALPSGVSVKNPACSCLPRSYRPAETLTHSLAVFTRTYSKSLSGAQPHCVPPEWEGEGALIPSDLSRNDLHEKKRKKSPPNAVKLAVAWARTVNTYIVFAVVWI